MKRNCFYILRVTLCIISFFLISCNDVDLVNFSKDIKIDESLVLPIGESNLTIKDVLSKYGLPNNMDTISNEIYFQWSFSNEMLLNNINLADSISPFNQTIFASPTTIIYPPNVPIQIPPYDGGFDLTVNKTGSKDRVDSVHVNSSLVNVQVDVSPEIAVQIPASDMTVEFVFPNDKLHIDNGNPIFSPDAYGQGKQIPFGSYSLKLLGSSTIPFTIKLYIKPQILPVTINPGSTITIKMNFSKIDFSVAYGFFNLFNNESKTAPMPIKIEDYLPDALMQFTNPIVNVTASTNVGADLNINVDYLKAYNTASPDNSIYAWFNNHTTNSISESIAGPQTLGAWGSKNFNQFDSKHGEIDHFFDTRPYPNMTNYQLSIKSDPRRAQNFMTPDSKLKIDVTTSLPLKLKSGSNYSLTDTIQNLNIGDILDYVDSAILVVNIKNGLPMKARYRMTYWKSDAVDDTINAVGGTISKIYDNSIPGNITSEYNINSAKVDSAGTVTEMTPQSLYIVLDKSQIAALKQTSYIIYSLALEGAKTNVGGIEKPNAIHFTTNNTFGVKLGIFVKGSKITSIGNAKN